MLEKISSAFTNIFRNISGMSRISEKNIEDTVEEIKNALLDADVNLRVVRRFVNSVAQEAKGEKVLKAVNPGQQFTKILYDKIVTLLGGNIASDGGESSEKAPPKLVLKNPDTTTVILMVGLQGSGKTTTSAKLALKLKNSGRRVLLAACDTVRAAAIEQLEQLGKGIGIEVFSEDKKDAVKNAVSSLSYAKKKQFDTLIIDTAGRLQVDEGMMKELRTTCEKVKADNTLFVMDAAAGQTGPDSAKAFNEAVNLTGVILTKFDSDARGGVALSVASVVQKPIIFVGTGEKVECLEDFHPERVASRILGMGDVVSFVEKAQEQVDEAAAEELQRKAARNEFTLTDMLAQFEQLAKMGPLQNVMEMLPGLAGQKVDESSIKWYKAIIQSMTKKERDNYLIIGPSRRKRIAKGSGTTLSQVNKLIKQFEKAKLMMKKVSRNKFMQAGLMKQLGL